MSDYVERPRKHATSDYHNKKCRYHTCFLHHTLYYVGIIIQNVSGRLKSTVGTNKINGEDEKIVKPSVTLEIIIDAWNIIIYSTKEFYVNLSYSSKGCVWCWTCDSIYNKGWNVEVWKPLVGNKIICKISLKTFCKPLVGNKIIFKINLKTFCKPKERKLLKNKRDKEKRRFFQRIIQVWPWMTN